MQPEIIIPSRSVRFLTLKVVFAALACSYQPGFANQRVDHEVSAEAGYGSVSAAKARVAADEAKPQSVKQSASKSTNKSQAARLAADQRTKNSQTAVVRINSIDHDIAAEAATTGLPVITAEHHFDAREQITAHLEPDDPSRTSFAPADSDKKPLTTRPTNDSARNPNAENSMATIAPDAVDQAQAVTARVSSELRAKARQALHQNKAHAERMPAAKSVVEQPATPTQPEQNASTPKPMQTPVLKSVVRHDSVATTELKTKVTETSPHPYVEETTPEMATFGAGAIINALPITRALSVQPARSVTASPETVNDVDQTNTTANQESSFKRAAATTTIPLSRDTAREAPVTSDARTDTHLQKTPSASDITRQLQAVQTETIQDARLPAKTAVSRFKDSLAGTTDNNKFITAKQPTALSQQRIEKTTAEDNAAQIDLKQLDIDPESIVAKINTLTQTKTDGSQPTKKAMRDAKDGNSVDVSDAITVDYTVKEHENLLAVADRFGVSVRVLQQFNPNLDDPMSTGQVIKVPVLLGVSSIVEPSDSLSESRDSSANSADPLGSNESKAEDPLKKSRIHEVQTGESLELIAKKYAVQVQDLASDNAVSPTAPLPPGTLLVIKLMSDGWQVE